MAGTVVGSVVFLLAMTACAVTDREEAVDTRGTIAFVSGLQRGSAIHVANADGTERLQLTRQRTRHDGVTVIAWSPDGSRIAYSGGLGGWNDNAYDDLYVIRVKGGQVLRLTSSYESDLNPEWSPDGRMLAFDRNDDGYNWIYVIKSDGTDLRRLTANFNWRLAWSPDGQITFTNGRGIWLMRRDGTGKRLLARVEVGTPGYGEPAGLRWSPDGTYIAYTYGGVLWVMNADGKHRRKLHTAPANRQAWGPVWSPDGETIAWAEGDGDFEIFTIDADGSALRKLTNNERIQDEAPSWSPDGRALAFVRTSEGDSDVYVMNADGSGQRNLSQTTADDWSPIWSPGSLVRVR
jgi:Tol biopolymer transport system component